MPVRMVEYVVLMVLVNVIKAIVVSLVLSVSNLKVKS